MVYATWLADVLRANGLNVVEHDGWKTAGRGPMTAIEGVICHHTGGPAKGDAPSLNLVRNGRPDLAGPLSQLVLARSGTFHVVAAGRCNHAGPGSWMGIAEGNSRMIGIEAENMGKVEDPWPEIQIDAYARGCAAILRHAGRTSIYCIGHKEWCRPIGRKIDPTFSMPAFRSKVDVFMKGAGLVTAENPAMSMMRIGMHNDDVKRLQGLLKIEVDGTFGPKTETAVKAYQKANGLEPDGLVGPKTWAKLLA